MLIRKITTRRSQNVLLKVFARLASGGRAGQRPRS